MAANNNHFGLTLDTVAPKGGISAQASYNAQGKVTITYDADASQMKVWYTSTQAGSKSDSNYPTEWEAVAKEKNTAFTSDGTYYYHVVFKDSVANESEVFNSDAIVYETKGVTINTVAINDDAAYTTNLENNKIVFTFTNNTVSAISSGTITGNIVGSPIAINLNSEELAAGSAERTFSFNTGVQGKQEVTVTLTTAAGNSSSASDTITVDTTPAAGVLTLRNSANTANLPLYINYVDVGVRIDCSATDWASCSISGPFANSPLNITVSADDRKNGYVFSQIKLNTGDGLKNITAKIYDTAGNVNTETMAASVTLDQTAPVISITPNRTTISRQTGYNSATLTLAVTEDAKASGQDAYRIYLDDNTSQSFTSGTLPASYVVNADVFTDTLDAEHVVHVEVRDKAGNTGTKTIAIKLDITAPAVTKPTITNYKGYVGGNLVDTAAGFVRFNQISVTSGAEDASAIAYSYCWINNKVTDTSLPEAAKKTGLKATFAYGDLLATSISEGDTNYVHVAYVDEVGNTAFGHSAGVIFDSTAPEAGAIDGLPDICHKITNVVSLVPKDTNISENHGWYKLWGDIKVGENAVSTEAMAVWTTYENPVISITFTGADSVASVTKTVYLKWRDAAGNVQTADAFSKTVQLDTSKPQASLTLVDTNNATNIGNSKRALNTFKARISGGDDGLTGTASAYVLYGNIKIGSTTYPTSLKTYNASTAYAAGDFVTYTPPKDSEGQAEPEQIRKITTAGTYATWTALTAASGDAFTPLTYNTPSGSPTYYLTDTITGTVTQGANPVYLKVRDDAGNVSDVVTQSFIYDTTAPVATVGNVDRAIISKVHEKLETKTSYISNDATAKDKEGYADYVAFNFTASEKVIAWKVCAYLTEEAAGNGSASDAAIPTTNGSINTSGAGIEADASIAVLINGADYEAALGEVGKVDGAHVVVVYVQDEAGTWSGKAVFA